jgi:hypothetical protein
MDILLFIIAIPLIILGWRFYLNISSSEEQTNFKNDKFGDYFLKDIKKVVDHLEKLPKKNQVNIYENIIYKYGKYCKEIWKLEVSRGREFKKIYKRYLEEAGEDRRENMTAEGYGNPRWLAAAIFETLLFSEGKKMSFDNGKKLRGYVFNKMKKALPNNKNLKIFLKVNS